jgi:hypothetical protein
VTKQRLPPQHERFIEPDGKPNRFVHAWMRGIQQRIDAGLLTPDDLADINAQLAVLNALRLYGTGGITVTGSLETGYGIHFSGGMDPLVAQIFGG